MKIKMKMTMWLRNLAKCSRLLEPTVQSWKVVDTFDELRTLPSPELSRRELFQGPAKNLLQYGISAFNITELLP